MSIDASVEGSDSRGKEEVNKAVRKFSQDVLNRTINKISERVLEKYPTTTLLSSCNLFAQALMTF